MEDKIKKAYKSSKNFYDDVLTNSSRMAKLYIKLFWDVDDNKIADTVLSNMADNFSGSLLDVPAGTGVFTHRKYAAMTSAMITCLDYSDAMLEKARLRFTAEGLNNVDCIQGDVSRLEFEDESFDIVL